MHHAVNTHVGKVVEIHGFLTSTLDGGELSASRHGRITPGERTFGTHWDRRLVRPQIHSGVFREEKKLLPLLGIERSVQSAARRHTD
jgi:hypothetical protein